MKLQITKKPFAFIIILTILSALPEFVSAQTLKKCNQRGKCPSGYHCYFGYCLKDCARCPGSLANESLFISSINSNAISFLMTQTKNVSVKLYDATGRLVKTLADKVFEEGEHTLQVDAAGINAGIYIVQFNTGAYSETKKNYCCKIISLKEYEKKLFLNYSLLLIFLELLSKGSK